MLKVLFSRRMVAFHLLVLVIVPSFVRLGFWQLDRWETRSESVRLQQDNVAAEPVPVEELTGVGEEVSPRDRWRTVEVSGTWDTEHELLLRNRDGSRGVGFHVLTPLVTEDGSAVLVNRGWIMRGDTALDVPDVPPAPEGTVEIAGRLQFTETEENTGLANRDGLPEGQIMIVDVDMLADRLPYPVLGGYVELTEQDPVPDPAPERIALREVDSGMSLSYAVQWWVFSVVAVVGWVVLMRRELRDARAEEEGGEPGGSDRPGGSGGTDGSTDPDAAGGSGDTDDSEDPDGARGSDGSDAAGGSAASGAPATPEGTHAGRQ
ncbi:SURF1 family cytochrome oxidase biogenesis protein [Nocardiopsis aegyptia]|uniref:SURF1-like protein n=1 Tax=Nocardiopsis aegyptia TaxID=220378 RepID=A0A7Z0ENM7_9ACTN|nr:SURF1 family protein [Nocardiopsis aegyptia]NYJ35450.1 cytochrome oxidase assembly protein ShyY1 [Nocardiopsis aegyptia]